MRVNQLWQKLALGLIGVAVAAILITFLLVNYVLDTRFRSYVNLREKAAYERIGESLAFIYTQSGGWNAGLNETLPHFAMMNRVAVEVRDARGTVVAGTPFAEDGMFRQMSRMMGNGQAIRELPEERVSVPIYAHGDKVGTVLITPLAPAGLLDEDQKFRRSINSSLLLGGLQAALVALGLSFIISTRLSKPLAQMTKAAKRMEGGDLTQRVQVETGDEIGQLGEAFNHLAVSLERQEHLRKNLTADVAHELRTPLAVVRSHIEAYLDGVLKPDPRNLQSIHEEIMRLQRLVDDLGELAQVEAGKLELEKTPVDIAALTASTAEGLRPYFEESEVDLEVRTNGLVLGECDKDKIKQVVVNLLSNAAKFTPAGGKVVVGVSEDKQAPEAVVTITDTGIGIDSGSLPYIFERFYRADKSRSRATGGSGIGLTIAKELVQMHGGTIDVESSPGHGSTFTVRLPTKTA